MDSLSKGPPAKPVRAARQKHSAIGIASFVLSVLALIFLFLWFFNIPAVILFSPLISDSGTFIDPYSPLVLIAGLVVNMVRCLCPILSLVGIGLGIGSVVQSRYKKVFGVIGLVLNGLILLSFCVLRVVLIVRNAYIQGVR